MPDTIRLQIIAAIAALLNGAGKPAGLNVDRKEYQAIEHAGLPRMVPYIAPGRQGGTTIEDTDPRATGRLDRTLRVVVETQVEFDPDDTTPDAAADPYLSWCEKALWADDDLGGLAYRIISIQLVGKEVEDKGRAFARYAQEVLVHYPTSRTNPEESG